ncbi:MAG TPA: hypothetical protein VK493_08480 [Bryobacteraceae bacterium]|nr:hypothetical protein [Bryobacteraceae bacterium]
MESARTLVAADLAAEFSRGSSAAVVSIRRLHLAAMLASLSAAIRHLDSL